MQSKNSDSNETERLLAEVRSGDRDALDRLFALHRRYLRQFVELRLDAKIKARIDPSDVVQEAQMEAVRRFDVYLANPPLPFRLWLRQLAYDRLLMARRRHLKAGRRTVDLEVALPAKSSLALARQLLARNSSPSERLDKAELARRVHDAVDRLSQADREILMMRTFEGLSFDEVACLLAIDAAAARKRHGRALLRLHTFLSESP